jgi:multisubunit Na+/H+ antiporter MnhG subunit
MAIDPVISRAARTPLFIVGVLLLVVGVVPIVWSMIFISGSNLIGPGILLWVCAPTGWFLLSRSMSRALQDWRKGN